MLYLYHIDDVFVLYWQCICIVFAGGPWFDTGAVMGASGKPQVSDGTLCSL